MSAPSRIAPSSMQPESRALGRKAPARLVLYKQAFTRIAYGARIPEIFIHAKENPIALSVVIEFEFEFEFEEAKSILSEWRVRRRISTRS